MTALDSIVGMPVISRSSAEALGTVRDAVLSADGRTVLAWQVGAGRRAKVVDHRHVTGFGSAAVVVDDEAHLRAARSPEETATARGRRSILGHRALGTDGNELSTVEEVDIDTDSGAVVSLRTGAGDHRAADIRALGSYAVVLSVQPSAPPATTGRPAAVMPPEDA